MSAGHRARPWWFGEAGAAALVGRLPTLSTADLCHAAAALRSGAVAADLIVLTLVAGGATAAEAQEILGELRRLRDRPRA